MTTTPTVWTIKALLNWTTEYLHKKGLESPRLEAQLLLAHTLGCRKIELLIRHDEVPDEPIREKYRALIRRRTEGWPTAYLVGQREFYLLEFEVNPAVLIPRPDTETLVLEAIKILNRRKKPAVLDLGTGSGCIAVSLAHQCEQAHVTAVDISPDALEVAARNAKRHGVTARMEFRNGDFLEAVPGGQYDLIVCNPPYVTTGEWQELMPEVRDHEPRLALDGGPDGLAFYRRLATDAAKFLKPDGELLAEIGSTQEPDVRRLFESSPDWKVEPSLKDLARRYRVVHARRK